MDFTSSFFFDFFQGSSNLLQFTLVDGIFETASFLVFLLELLELFLFLFEFSKSSVNVIQKVVDLVAFCISLSHDSERFCTALLIDLGSGNFFQEG